MSEDCSESRPDKGLRRHGFLACITVLAGIAALGACNGDTLYDDGPPVEIGAPLVEIRSPGTGQEIVAGKSVAVRVFAEDTLGVSQIELSYQGVVSGVIRFTFVPPRTSVTVDTVIAVPAGATGKLDLRATSTNAKGLTGNSGAVSLRVSLADSVAPTVARTVEAGARMELTDSIRVRVLASDNTGGSGLTSVGVTALVTSSLTTDTTVFTQVVDLGGARSGTVTTDVVFPPPAASANALPNTLTLHVFAFAVDEAGNCAAAASDAPQRLTCGTFRTATVAGGVPQPIQTTIVAGRSVLLPTGSSIPDAAVDVGRDRLYLSNLSRNRVDVLNARTLTFESSVAVGSEPWGLGLSRNGDTLIVANSGGTNISYVPLGGTLTEAVGRRIHTPNTVLFEIHRSRDAQFFERLSVTFIDFSDRPQFIAQDAAGRLLYSTKPTGAARDGTIRVATNSVGWQQPEVKLLLGEFFTIADSTTVAVAHVDSMRVFSPVAGNDMIEIYDHVPGFPSQIVKSGIKTLNAALTFMENDPNSDILDRPGHFDLLVVGLKDTTFVAASGDRRKVAFGEGSTASGRVIMWDSPTSSISNEITVADLVGNSAEHILGLDMNQDGTLTTARGVQAAYYFKNDLRLQGVFTSPVTTGGSGSVLHPQHPSFVTQPGSTSSTLAFVADGAAVRIVDTVHFNERGRIEVRDPLVGPLRVSTPLSGETANCPGPDCIVAKLYGVTQKGTVVIVNVRTRDIQ